MIRKLKVTIASLLSALMVLGAVAIAPTQLQAATPLPVPTINITENQLVWSVENPHPAAFVEISIGGTVVSSNAPAVAGNGTFNLTPHRSPGTHQVSVRLILDANLAGALGYATSSNAAVRNWIVEDTTTQTEFGAPQNVTVSTGNVLSWTAVPDATHYEIFVGDTRVAGTTAATWNISVQALAAQNIPEGQPVHFYVVAENRTNPGNVIVSARSARVTWTMTDANLPTPQISVTAEGLLTWTGAGAQNVRVYRNGTPLQPTLEGVSFVDLTTLNLPAGTQRIQIRFLNSAGANASNLSNEANVNLSGQLPTPTGVSISAATLTWTAVPNAQGIAIYVGGARRNISPALAGNATTFNLATLALGSGNHNIQIRALGDGTATLNSALSTGVNFTPGAIAVPTNVNITGNTLTWTAVSNAEGYHVYVDGTVRTTAAVTATTFDLGTLNLPVGQYDVQVRALGNNTSTHHSNLSAAVRFSMATVQLAAPTNVRLEGSVLHWDAVPNAASYRIYRGEIANSPLITTTFQALDALELPVGNHYLSVRAVGDGTTTQDSPLSTPPIAFTQAGAPITPQRPVINPNDPPSGWSTGYVERAAAAGIVPAQLMGSFRSATTRAEFTALAVMLYEEVRGYTIQPTVTFNDTNDPNVLKMGTLGVVEGMGGGYFEPNRPLTRAQAATMIARLAAAMQQPLPAAHPTFPDNDDIQPWAVASVGQVQAAGIMTGADQNRFWPEWDYTREQSIVTMLRLFDIVN